MSDDQDQPRRGGDAGTERALDELRLALEQLATRMGAGFREDLAQIRAIAASVAERDLTSDVEALRVDVATLVGRDGSAELQADVAAIRAELGRLASRDDVTDGVRSGLSPLQAAVDRIAARLDDDSGRTQVLARFEALEARLDQLAGGDGSAEVLARLDALSGRLDAMPTAPQVTNLPGDLRAHLADELADVRSRLGDGPGSLLEQLQDNLADVASGEVVGALWDEVRQLRTDLPDLVAVPEPAAPPADAHPQLAALTDELAVLRTELAEGLVVEPSGALSASLDDLKVELDELRASLGDLRATPEPVAAPVDDGREEQLLGQLESIRTFVDEVRSRLDAADDVTGPAPADRAEIAAIVADQVSSLRSYMGSELDSVREAIGARVVVDAEVEQAHRAALSDEPDRADIETLADQVAAMRDFIATELETLRQTVAARLDAATEATAATVATAASEPPAGPAPQATLDPEAIASLRDEIRAAGAIPDHVIDALREELKALRRRIAVKASERVLDDQQLAQIADAVAARLAQDRTDG